MLYIGATYTGAATTNIYKLFSALTGPLENDQIPFVRATQKNIGLYFRGIGNDEDNARTMGFYAGAFGAGEKSIRDHAYASLCKHYRPGDRISIFGFSRGAASARLLARKLEKYGLPEEITLHYKEAKNKCTGEKEWFFTKYDAENENAAKASVSFLGLFDTVGAFGIPVNLGPLNFQKINLFRDLTLAGNVEQTVHLLAIDESREPFVPTFINIRDSVEEVWFPGVHADVGGGYRDGALGNITMDYMVQRLHDVLVDPVVVFNKRLNKYREYDLGSDDFVLHYHGDGAAKSPRDIEVLHNDKPAKNKMPRVHESALRLREGGNFFYTERLNSFATRVPIAYDPVNLKSLGENIKKVSN